MRDDFFPGFDFVVEQLAKLKDHQLVWKHVDWAMNKDQVKAVEIFTQRSADELSSERMRTDIVLENLSSFKTALTLYLEHVIFAKNVKKEKYHTQLVSIYLESVIEHLKIPVEKQTLDKLEQLNASR